jgi:hypothetical protein
MDLIELIKIILNLRVIGFIRVKESITGRGNNSQPFEDNNFIFFLEFHSVRFYIVQFYFARFHFFRFLFFGFHFFLSHFAIFLNSFIRISIFFFRKIQKKTLLVEEDQFTFLWLPFFLGLASTPYSRPSTPQIRNQLLLTIIRFFNLPFSNIH